MSKGFINWKDATVKFSIHEASDCHEEAVLKTVPLPSTAQKVADCLSNSPKKEKMELRQCFLKVLSNIRYLARRGLPLRGHGNPETQIESKSNIFAAYEAKA